MASAPAAWPLLAQVLDEVHSPDDLVRWGHDAWFKMRVVGIRELRVAAVLFALSREVEGSPAWLRWEGLLGSEFQEDLFDQTSHPASLLDVALRLGHAEIARCLREHGQRQLSPLGLQDLQCLPTDSLGEMALKVPNGRWYWHSDWQWKEEFATWVKQGWVWRDGRWGALRELHDPVCPWMQGAGSRDWAPDWRAPVFRAQLLVDTAATRAALALLAEGVPLDVEEGAELRLLDAALLLGHAAAAAVLAGRCGARRPARLWVHPRDGERPERIAAHLRAGLRDMRALGFSSTAGVAEVAVGLGSPDLAAALPEALGGDEQLPPLHLSASDLVGRGDSGLAVVPTKSLDALEALAPLAPTCAVDIRKLLPNPSADADSDEEEEEEEEEAQEVSLLFFAVLLGDSRAARRLAGVGFTFANEDVGDAWLLAEPELGQLVGRTLRPHASRLDAAKSTLRQLFAAAARCSLSTLAASGLLRPAAPVELLENLAGFAARWSDAEEGLRQEVKQHIGQDPLTDVAVGFRRVSSRVAPSPAAAAAAAAAMQAGSLTSAGRASSEPSAAVRPGHPAERFGDDVTEAAWERPADPQQGSGTGEPLSTPSAGSTRVAAGAEGQADDKDEVLESEELAQALQESESEAVQAEQQDVQRAVLLSKEEAFDGETYQLFRLDKHSPEVFELLLTSEELRPCRERVLAAGCEVRPAWAGGALLLVPTTRELYVSELGLELKHYNVLLLRSDVGCLRAALQALPCRRRPQLKDDHRANWYEETAEGAGHAEPSVREGSPRQGGPGRAEEGQQPAGEGSVAEAVGPEGGAGGARLAIAAAQEEWMQCEGVKVQATFLGRPADSDNFELSEVSSAAVAKSAPADVSRAPEEAPSRSPRSASGPHARNPRRWQGSRPAEDPLESSPSRA